MNFLFALWEVMRVIGILMNPSALTISKREVLCIRGLFSIKKIRYQNQ